MLKFTTTLLLLFGFALAQQDDPTQYSAGTITVATLLLVAVVIGVTLLVAPKVREHFKKKNNQK